MLRQVSNGQYLEAIRMAEKFILHVEVLFATIDDLEWQFSRLNLKGASSHFVVLCFHQERHLTVTLPLFCPLSL